MKLIGNRSKPIISRGLVGLDSHQESIEIVETVASLLSECIFGKLVIFVKIAGGRTV